MIRNEWGQADSDKKDLIRTCPMVMKCIEGFPTCQVCMANEWIKILSNQPRAVFDFDRPGGHAAARAKVAKVTL